MHVEGEAGPVVASLLPLGEGLLRGFMVVAPRPWPVGTVVVDLGVERSSTLLEFKVPRPQSVTADPSFELGEKDVWFGRAEDAFAIPETELPPQTESTWLVVEYESPRFESDSPSGAVFLDHLRFE